MFGLKKRYSKTSFSQSGEDLLVQFAFKAMGEQLVSAASGGLVRMTDIPRES